MKDRFIIIYMLIFWFVGSLVIFLNDLDKIVYIWLLIIILIIQPILLIINWKKKLKEEQLE